MKAYLEVDEVKKLEAAADTTRDWLLVRLLFHLGARVSEVLSLTVDNIDFRRGTVTIRHLKTRTKASCAKCGSSLGRSHSFCPKCGEKIDEFVAKEQQRQRMRTLPLDKKTLAVLADYVKRGGPVRRDDKDYIFEFGRHRAWQIIADLAKKAGLPKVVNPESGRKHNVSPHRLRDAFAVHAMQLNDSGVGLRLLQEHLGHASFDTTAKYRKISGKEHRDWYDALWQKGKKDDGPQVKA
ncbi:MAG: integrase [Dehalococcoidia bacterium]|nr:MAG: integrase [Dehalococcoidia bacterium]